MLSAISLQGPWGTVSAVIAGEGSTGILLAHGAGTTQDHPTISLLRDRLASAGHTAMSFNYPYAERGSKRPDSRDRLLDCHRAAADRLASDVEEVFLAGRSMGGRMGTYLVADGYRADGLVLYAYPLHPAGKPDRLRIDQFEQIAIPMLFFQGTRDPLARQDLFDRHIARLPNAEVEVLEGAGHGARGAWTVESLTERYLAGTLAFIEQVSSGNSGAGGA